MKFINCNYCCVFIFLVFLLKKYLFVCLCLILVLAHGIFDLHCTMQDLLVLGCDLSVVACGI